MPMERRAGTLRLARAAHRLVSLRLRRPPATLHCLSAAMSTIAVHNPSAACIVESACLTTDDADSPNDATRSSSDRNAPSQWPVVASGEFGLSCSRAFAQMRGGAINSGTAATVAARWQFEGVRAVDGRSCFPASGQRLVHISAYRQVPSVDTTAAVMPASLETNRASVADDNHPSAPSAPSAQSAPSAHHDSTQLRFNSVEEVPPLLLDLFRGWRMDDRQVLLLMRGRPGLARIDVAEKVLPGVRLLLACGVQPRDLAQSARYDSVWLGQPVEKIKEVVTFLRGLGLKDGESLGTVLRRFPRAFSCNAAIQLQPRVQKLLDLGIDDISYIIKACPRLLLISAERVQERLDFLAQVAGEGHVTSIVRRQPYILTQPITELQSKLDVFRDILGSEEDALKVFRQIRRLPAHSASKMTSTFHTLCEIVGPENAQKVVGKRSSILSTNSTTMRSNFEHWRALLSHLPPPKLANLFVRYPALLHLSWKSNIEPKAEFFERELGLSLAAVAAVPLVACYSLEQRIRPRVQRLQEAGIGIVETDKGIVCLPRGMVDGGRWRNADGGDSSSGSWEENDRGRNEGDNAQVQMGKADLGGDIGSRTDHGHLVVSEGYEEGLKFEGQQGENVKPGQVQQRAVSLSTLIQASKDRFDELLKKLVNGVDDWDKA